MTFPNEFISLLDEFIEKFVTTVPTDIANSEVLNLESLLNNIYQYQLDAGGPADLDEAVIHALSQVSEMSDKIKKNPNLVRDTVFFSSLKRLPRLLKVIRLYLDDQHIN